MNNLEREVSLSCSLDHPIDESDYCARLEVVLKIQWAAAVVPLMAAVVAVASPAQADQIPIAEWSTPGHGWGNTVETWTKVSCTQPTVLESVGSKEAKAKLCFYRGSQWHVLAALEISNNKANVLILHHVTVGMVNGMTGQTGGETSSFRSCPSYPISAGGGAECDSGSVDHHYVNQTVKGEAYITFWSDAQKKWIDKTITTMPVNLT
ncbi:hypothetical protein ACFWC5_32550 [Streptomyces sp. NPDC060085]|uniref:hypothetical protein n=1 Tax=Streptomyces sp. NPDC060085 TaxID=3347054 RepID=UPI0036600A9A